MPWLVRFFFKKVSKLPNSRLHPIVPQRVWPNQGKGEKVQKIPI
ncbi:hypothetical protein HMPREF9374_0719 [Desmospora sp. 8437]|nr:hypothetical protein HMPREF9374_0719 [Desmospora sp. 8437]